MKRALRKDAAGPSVLVDVTTVGTEEQALTIAHHLVEKHLAACVNIVPRIRSVFFWKGKVNDDGEWLLLIKTAPGNFAELRDAIRRLHSVRPPRDPRLRRRSGRPWRIIKTLGKDFVKLQPVHGSCVETAAAGVILSAASIGMPVSTTHVITSSILGVGLTRRMSAVNWNVAYRVLWAWVLTIPASAVVAFITYVTLSPFLGM